MEHEYQVRAQDTELAKLTGRVQELDNDVRKLRHDFEGHIIIEDKKYIAMQASLNLLQSKIDQLLIDIKEPIEVYKTAKAGVTFVKFMSDAAKWAVPLLLGLWIGYGSLSNTEPVKIKQTNIIQGEKQ